MTEKTEKTETTQNTSPVSKPRTGKVYVEPVRYPSVVLGNLGAFERGKPRQVEAAVAEDLTKRKGFRIVADDEAKKLLSSKS